MKATAFHDDNTLLFERLLVFCAHCGRYNNAPFVFDVYLNPNKFPFEPPLVHFHSHTNGLGRCNRECVPSAITALPSG